VASIENPKSKTESGAKGAILRFALRLLSATWRVREEIPDDCRAIIDGTERGIIAFWHGKMFPVWYRFRERGSSALISGSRDGELLARYLDRSLGYREVIRGSSSKGGSRALAEMVDVLSRRPLLITPDGPRGPAREGKPGVLVAAVRAGRSVILAGWSCRRSVRLNSWDSMEIPYPFSTIKFRYCKFEFIDHDTRNRADERKSDAEDEGRDERKEGVSDGGRSDAREMKRDTDEMKRDERRSDADESKNDAGNGDGSDTGDGREKESEGERDDAGRKDDEGKKDDASRLSERSTDDRPASHDGAEGPVHEWIDESLLQHFNTELNRISEPKDHSLPSARSK